MTEYSVVQFVSIGDPLMAHELMQISDTADKGWMYRPFEVCICQGMLPENVPGGRKIF